MGDVKGNCVVRWCKREAENNIQNRKNLHISLIIYKEKKEHVKDLLF